MNLCHYYNQYMHVFIYIIYITQIFWYSIYLTYLLAFDLGMIIWHFIWHIFWHSI